MSQLPALQRTVFDLIEEHDRKAAAVEAEITAFEAAQDRLGMAATVQGTFIDTVVKPSYLHAETLRKNLLKSGWKAIYNRLLPYLSLSSLLILGGMAMLQEFR